MLLDFVTIKNIFDNPDRLIELAKQQQFYTRDEHYHNYGETYFDGVRSKSLHDIDPELNLKVFEEIFLKVYKDRFKYDLRHMKFVFGYKTQAYFHVMRDCDVYHNMWKHKDEDSIMAGLVYLNKTPKEGTGTTVYRFSGEKVDVANEFNKLVLYSSSMWHHPNGGFGNNAEDGRLTLVFFVQEFKTKIEMGEYNEENKK